MTPLRRRCPRLRTKPFRRLLPAYVPETCRAARRCRRRPAHHRRLDVDEGMAGSANGGGGPGPAAPGRACERSGRERTRAADGALGHSFLAQLGGRSPAAACRLDHTCPGELMFAGGDLTRTASPGGPGDGGGSGRGWPPSRLRPPVPRPVLAARPRGYGVAQWDAGSHRRGYSQAVPGDPAASGPRAQGARRGAGGQDRGLVLVSWTVLGPLETQPRGGAGARRPRRRRRGSRGRRRGGPAPCRPSAIPGRGRRTRRS
jgi:hypothetical protein